MSGPSLRSRVGVSIGKSAQAVGELTYVKDGRREYSVFAYGSEWLANPLGFEISPDLPMIREYSTRRAPTKDDSCFHFALADTAPDAWGRRVIARAHVKERQLNPALPALTELDYLRAVDDFSRIGALRLQDDASQLLKTVQEGRRSTPPLVDLRQIYDASRAVEGGTETAEDLKYLRGKGTSLGGMRPKCTLLDEDGALALGKFPSIGDVREVTRGEVLALRLARRAGIEAADARIVVLSGTPIAVIRRFDRTADDSRIPYLSAASMLQMARNEDRTYTEVADVIRAKCAHPIADAQQLWRRLVFNLLITNVDDHLHNLGFLYVGQGKWRMAPSFDLNPFPDKDRESKTWLSEEAGPIESLGPLMQHADYFGLSPSDALTVLAEIHGVIRDWRALAQVPEIGLSKSDLKSFEAAFEHREMHEALNLLG